MDRVADHNGICNSKSNMEYIGKMIRKMCCIFGGHVWEKFMGFSNIGNGNFLQRYKCSRCGIFKEVIK